MKTLLSFLFSFLALSALAADGYLSVTNSTTRGGGAGGGGAGDVTQAGQNNFTGSNSLSGVTVFSKNGVNTTIDSNTITSGTMTLSGTGTNYLGADTRIFGNLYSKSNTLVSLPTNAPSDGAIPVATGATGDAKWGNTITVATRSFTHDSTHTVITNTATLTSSEWTAGSQKEWYNGATTMTIDKTNGAITMNGALSFATNLQATANFNRGWAMTNPAASYTQAAPIGVDAALLTFQQTLYTITNSGASAITVTLPAGLKKATWWGTNVTAFVVTNATMQWWTCRPGETNVYIEGGY